MNVLKNIFAFIILYSVIGNSQNFIVTKSFTGSWYDPDNSGQGFLLEIINSNGEKKALTTWYTYDNSGNQMWLFGVGTIQQQQISFNMKSTIGGGFANNNNPNNITTQDWGTLNMQFSDCNSASISWSPISADFESGTMSLNRLTRINNINCTGGLSDEIAGTAGIDEFRINLLNLGLDADASGKAKYKQRTDRIDFSVEIEDLPIGSYQLLVNDDLKGDIQVTDNQGVIEGEIEFRDPIEPGKILLDFDPRGATIQVAQNGDVYLSSTLPNSGNDTGGTSNQAPPFGDSRTTIFLNNLGIINSGKVKVKLRQRDDRVDFSVEIEDVPLGFYDLVVDSITVGIIEVIASNSENQGEIEFRNPVESGKQILDFNPIGQLIEIIQDGRVYFSGTLTTNDNGNPNNPPVNTPLRVRVDFNNLGVDSDADGKIDYRNRTNSKKLKVEIEDVDDGTYQLFVGNEQVADILVVNAIGEIEFKDPVEPGKLQLNFDPLNQLFEIKQAGVVFLSVILE